MQAPFPHEVWTRVFSHLDVASPHQFSLVSRKFRAISGDPHARAAWLVSRYGKPLALYFAFRAHRGVLSTEVGKLMIAAGCGLPRFLVQLVDKEYHRLDRTRRPVSAAIFVFFITMGFKVYGYNADFKEDDVARFERTLYGSTLAAAEAIETIRTLVQQYLFVPVRGLGSPVDETVYSLVENGLELPFVNDLILEKVLWRTDLTDAILQSYLSVGFELTGPVIKKGVQMARQSTLDILRLRVPQERLQRLAEETVIDIFGPTIRGWVFSPEAVDFIVNAFPVSEDVMETALFRIPGAPSDLPDSFPATRCYMKANPCPVWIWILRVYGPAHRFTMACFDDALSRAAAERDLHALHDVYLDAGVQFRPRHVKILACRVLHRDMTANALHLLKVMRSQVVTAAKEYAKELVAAAVAAAAAKAQAMQAEGGGGGFSVAESGASPPPSEPPSIPSAAAAAAAATAAAAASNVLTPQAREVWVKALRDEIVDNEEWDHRMRTTQLEGGPRGGAYRISRPPDDALKFLDEARDFVTDLCSNFIVNPPIPSAGAGASPTVMGLMYGATVGRSGGVGGAGGGGGGPSRFRGSVVVGGRTSSSSLRGRRRQYAPRQHSAPPASHSGGSGGSASGAASGASGSASGTGLRVRSPRTTAATTAMTQEPGSDGEGGVPASPASATGGGGGGAVNEDTDVDAGGLSDAPETTADDGRTNGGDDGEATTQDDEADDGVVGDEDFGSGGGGERASTMPRAAGGGGSSSSTQSQRRLSISRAARDGLSRRLSSWWSNISERGMFNNN
ncbi:hypothetical protein DFJ73DRAFT_764208 [Zopfochytrium polystomum]|nr:hypothetical protein DFJ73DRAFT_764208 [Zopfochytrium polystomum]